MTRQSFFLHGRFIRDETEIELPQDVSHHIARVLRLWRDDIVEIRDESGRSWKARISKIAGKRVWVSLIEEVFLGNEPPIDIWLFLALARSDRVDLAIRQATELGVQEIVLFPSARSQYNIDASKISDKISRWTKIAKEALCQCRRQYFPRIFYFPTLHEALSFAEKEAGFQGEFLKIVAAEGCLNKLPKYISKDTLKLFEKIAVAIGPEGGWSSEERLAFESKGWVPISLGPRILRYETAVVVALSLCQFLWGDLGDFVD